MIVGSLALILVAAAALVAGLVWDSNALLAGSIVGSVVAAVVLFVSTRRSAERTDPAGPRDGAKAESSRERRGRVDHEATSRLGARRSTEAREARTAMGRGSRGVDAVEERQRQSRHAAPPTQPVESRGRQATPPPPPPPSGMPKDYDRGADDRDRHNDHAGDAMLDEDPPDEPPPQRTNPLDAARVARLDTEVLVIDGRPRYHLSGCVHLLGREAEPLPVSEAIELGFTPCSLCEPDTALLANAGR